MNTFRTEIEPANRLFMAAVKSRDGESFVRLATPDAILSLPGRDPLVGASGVRTFFASFAARGSARRHPDRLGLTPAGFACLPVVPS